MTKAGEANGVDHSRSILVVNSDGKKTFTGLYHERICMADATISQDTTAHVCSVHATVESIGEWEVGEWPSLALIEYGNHSAHHSGAYCRYSSYCGIQALRSTVLFNKYRCVCLSNSFPNAISSLYMKHLHRSISNRIASQNPDPIRLQMWYHKHQNIFHLWLVT